jgi:myo-inositol-1(or 4)-monophosphatase
MLTEDEIEARHVTAVEIARQAGMHALRLFRTKMRFELKSGDELVTEADRAIELLIRSELRKHWPEDGLFGEEFRGSIDGSVSWIIDPIDGSNNYSSGIAHWCVSIALMYNRGFALGVIFDPCHDELYSAIAGKGAWLNNIPLLCRPLAAVRGSVIGFGLTQKIEASGTLEVLARLAAAGATFRAQGAGGLTIAQIATGRLDAFFEELIFIWDVAAAVIILRESGGEAYYCFDPEKPTNGFAFVAVRAGLSPRLIEALPAEFAGKLGSSNL